ncbi:class I SAM-dependent methyltransferase [Nibrella viscosa]|uniref:class I SAM-dependent methyltransferase n=1 Tax=Nibrella viscosa TaxID=1084524 RepID=UPI0031EDFBD9
MQETTWDRVVSFIQRKIFRSYKARLDHQYKHGGWEWLGRLDELAHHQILAGYFNYLKRGGTILDLGSGEGVLNDSIQKQNYSRYVGVDLSGEAARIGNEKRGDEKTTFYQGNMDTYVPEGTFDVICINEALYFSGDAVKLLNRLQAYLAPDGFFMISLLSPKGDAIWSNLYPYYEFLDENKVTNIRNVTWTCRILKPRSR